MVATLTSRGTQRCSTNCFGNGQVQGPSAHERPVAAVCEFTGLLQSVARPRGGECTGGEVRLDTAWWW